MRIFIFLSLTVFLALATTKAAFSENRYWINGSGNWSDPQQWSETSGGTPGASVPTKDDPVIFDNNSFTSDNQTVIIKEVVYCNDFRWEVDNYQPTLKSSSFLFKKWTKAAIQVHGSLIINENVNHAFFGDIVLKSEKESTIEVDSKLTADLIIDAENGTYLLNRDLKTEEDIYLKTGIFNTNNKNIETHAFIGSGTEKRALYLGKTTINTSVWDFGVTENIDFVSGNSKIILNNNINSRSLQTGGLKYATIENKQTFSKGTFSLILSSDSASCYNLDDGKIYVKIDGTPVYPVTYELFLSENFPAGPNEMIIENSNDDSISFEGVYAGDYFVWVVDNDSPVGKTGTTINVYEPDELLPGAITITKGLSCFDSEDGEMQANPSGGTPPYTYQWYEWDGVDFIMIPGETNQQLSNIGQGTYQVIINDANLCGTVSAQKIFNKTFTPSYVPDEILINQVDYTNSCTTPNNTGTITISGSGGTGVLTYAIVRTSDNDSTTNATGVFENLIADTYRIYVIDANGCVKQGSDITLTQLVNPTASIIPDNPTVCPNSTIELDGNPTLSPDGSSFDSHEWTGDISYLDFSDIQKPDFTGSLTGTFNLAYTVTDNNGCTGTDNVVITVEDNDPPTAVCKDITVELDATGSVTITGADIDDGSSDNCTSPANLTLTATPNNFDCNDLGDNNVTLIVTDEEGNTSTCTSTVTVEDNIAPTLTCPGNVVQDNDPGVCTAVVNGLAPTTDDNCGVVLQTWTMSGATTGSSPATGIHDISGTAFNSGVTTVTYHVEDISGNFNECSFTVTINDTEAPTITCPPDATANTSDDGTGDCSTTVALGTPTTNDNCGINSVIAQVGGTAIDPLTYQFTTGITTVTWIVEDDAGNTASCTQDVTVIDDEDPTISCPADIIVNTSDDGSGDCSTTAALGTPTTDDNCGVSSVIAQVGGTTIDPLTYQFTTGITTVTWIVEDDAGNTASCFQNVTVVDDEDPTITCPNDTTVIQDGGGSCNAVVNGLTPATDDNCGVVLQTWAMTGATTNSSIGTGINDVSGEVFEIGVTTVEYTIEDAAGNSSVCSFTVEIYDEVDGGSIQADQNICYNTLPAELTNVVSASVCGGYTYQWQKKTGTGGWSDIPGATGENYQEISPLTETTYYTRRAISDLGFGTANSDTVTIIITPAPTVFAGEDTTLCYGTPYQILDADTTYSDGINWEVLTGNGTLDDINILDPIYTPVLLDGGTIVELVLHASGLSNCNDVTDTLRITYLPELLVSIGKPSPFLIDSTSTEINVSFNISNHEYVSLIGLYLVSPLDSVVELKPICSDIGLITPKVNLDVEFYNDPDNSTVLTPISTCAPGDGDYLFSGAWKKKLHGQDPANGAWRLMIKDSLNFGSPGVFEQGEIRFGDINYEGNFEVVVYADTMINLPIKGHTGSGSAAVTMHALSLTGLTTSCYGVCDATAVATASGGQPPYVLYEWSNVPDFSNIIATTDTVDLCAGTFYLRVTDSHGCSAIDSVTVGTPPEIIIDSDTVVHNTCYGYTDGKIALAFSGGTGALQYTHNGTDWYNSGDTIENLAAGEYLVTIIDANQCTKDTLITILEPDPVVISTTWSDISCYNSADGQIEITATGGTVPYEFSIDSGQTWQLSNTFSGLASDTFYVAVQDQLGCIQFGDTVYMNNPDSIAIDSVDVTHVACDGSATDGEIVVYAHGGTGDLEYSINSGADYFSDSLFTGLNGGNYQIVVRDENGCTKILDTLVTINGPIIITDETVVHNSCFGYADGEITLTFTGGTGLLQYSINGLDWYNSGETMENLPADTYVVIIQDATGCAINTEITINQPDPINIVTSYSDITCNGYSDGEIEIIATEGTSPYEYSIDSGQTWHTTNVFSGLSIDTFYVAVQDNNGCIQFGDTIVIQEAEPLIISVIDKMDEYQCINSSKRDVNETGLISVEVSGGKGDYQYNWLYGLNPVSGDETIHNLSAGTYELTVEDSLGCEKDTTFTIGSDASYDLEFSVVIEDTTICWYQPIQFTFNSTNADSIEIQKYRPVSSYSYIEITDETMEYDYGITEDNYFNLKAYNDYCEEDYITEEFKYFPDRELSIIENDDNENDTIIIKGDNGRWNALAYVTNPNGLVVEWLPNDGVSSPDSLNTIIYPAESMWYAVKITTVEGQCTDTDSIYVTYVPDIITYDGFSPNGDGINDFWYIENINAFKNNVVTVYNRWGTKVYEQKGYNNNDSGKRWDGTAKNGKQVGSGTYYYVIILNEEGFSSVTGAVTIMR